jgi:hypothetical protein
MACAYGLKNEIASDLELGFHPELDGTGFLQAL